MSHAFRWLALAFLLAVASAHSMATAAAPTSSEDKAKQVWQLLDYIAADYSGAVKDGKIADQGEFDEMSEFAQLAENQLQALPEHPARSELMAAAKRLRVDIAEKKSGAEVSSRARRLASDLLSAYPVATAPARAPGLDAARALFQAQCASCHGANGDGKGPLARSLSPAPVAFTDRERARERSVFALYQAITTGVEGTSMASFKTLPEEDRWALAFFVSGMAFSASEVKAGERLWATDPGLKSAFPSLSTLTSVEESSLGTRIGGSRAGEILAYLRTHPEALAASGSQVVARTRDKLQQSRQAFDQGDRVAAGRLALSAYLDEFEAVEPVLATTNKALLVSVEGRMAAYRAALANGDRKAVDAAQQDLNTALDQAAAALAESRDDALAIFLAALTVLLREGIEALLVVVAMIAFLKKAERTDALPWIHAGWTMALLTGAATWFMATNVIQFSGASRELIEGVSALLAAIVLIAVGVWMHQKSLAGQWQAYVRERLTSALGKGSARMLFLLAFITVYREVFETILFYAAMWRPETAVPVVAGFLSAAALLLVIAVVLLRTSTRLPISLFFRLSSFVVAVLAVALFGKGIAALQEAGYLSLNPVAFPRVDLLGIYPSTESLTGQLLALALILSGLALNLLSSRHKAKSRARSANVSGE